MKLLTRKRYTALLLAEQHAKDMDRMIEAMGDAEVLGEELERRWPAAKFNPMIRANVI